MKRVFRRRKPRRVRIEPSKWDFGPGGAGGPDGGVREPRNPLGSPPADTIQLPEPR